MLLEKKQLIHIFGVENDDFGNRISIESTYTQNKFPMHIITAAYVK